jgi:hypothetical protein
LDEAISHYDRPETAYLNAEGEAWLRDMSAVLVLGAALPTVGPTPVVPVLSPFPILAKTELIPVFTPAIPLKAGLALKYSADLAEILQCGVTFL